MLPAIIPARGGSKGIFRKNLKLLGGKPLIWHTISFCQKIDLFDGVYVSTEDEEIKKVAEQFGAIVIDRPAEYAQDLSTDLEFLNHFFGLVECEEVALMRPTTPFRSKRFVENTIDDYFGIKYKFTGLRSMHVTDINPFKVFTVFHDGLCKSFFEDFNGNKDFSNLPRQIFPVAYKPNGHIDIVKKEIVDSGSVFGDKIYAAQGEEIVDIDSVEDFSYAEYLIKEKKVI